MITSAGNARVKQVVQWQNKAKERKKDGIFLAEGIKMFEEAPTESIVEVFVSEDLEQKLKSTEVSDTDALYKKKLHETGYEIVADDVFAKMSDTQTPQGILTILKRPEYNLDLLLQEENPVFVILENLQDPGNLGTIVRTAEGAGITGVIMSAGTVDIFNPKTIRATMGSIYRVPFLYVEDMADTIQKLHKHGVHTYAAHLAGKTYYQDVSLKEPTAFLIGNEGNGLTKETADMAESYIKIPMEGQVESLNAAVATALLLYEAHRQRHGEIQSK
ncbi:MAG: RNA methyltransferase [Lachnospiraceae bacterium]|nr:RNA methyltransferase [Lachnospiraceae bacterium]